MIGLLRAELHRFSVRPAIRWVAAAMLLHVVVVLVLWVSGPGRPSSVAVEQGAVAAHALGAVVLALVAGVLLVTGEAASGGTRAVLTVEPRRGRVYWSKVLAAGLAVVPGVALAYSLLAYGAYALVARAGVVAGPEAWDLAWSGARVVAAAGCAAAAGAALGLLVRRWWVAFAAVLVWAGAEWVVVAGVTSAGPDRLLFAPADAWVRGAGPQDGLVLLAVTATVAVLGAVVFSRRDVR